VVDKLLDKLLNQLLNLLFFMVDLVLDLELGQVELLYTYILTKIFPLDMLTL
jgi:hypothetical protein